MRMIFTLLVLLAILPLGLRGQDGVSVWDGTIATKFAGGDGSKENPYQISNGAELAYFAKEVYDASSPMFTDKYFKLTNNIKLNDTENWEEWSNDNSPNNEWKTIGDYDGSDGFDGHFDGCGYTIEGLYIKLSFYKFGGDKIYNYGEGLFANIRSNAIIENVTVSKGFIAAGQTIGGIAARNYGTIKNCVNNCNIEAYKIEQGNGVPSYGVRYGSTTGGIVGENNGIVESCVNNGKVKAEGTCIGGIVGDNKGSVIECKNLASVNSDGDKVGGIAGSSSILINKSHNCSNINGNDYVGGIVGDASGELSNCHNKGNIGGNTKIGGIAGKSSYLTSTYYNRSALYNEGVISGNDYVGGIFGDYTTSSSSSKSWCSGLCNIGKIECDGSNKGGIYYKTFATNILSSYYLDTTCPDGKDKDKNAASIDQFKSGEVAAGLGSKWGQHLGIADYPVLKFCDPDAPTVYKVEFKTGDFGSAELFKAYYAYTGTEIFAPEENPSPKSDKYKFVGWFYSWDGNNGELQQPYVINNESESFYAYFAEFYTINFNPNGGSGSMDKLELFCKDNDEADTQELLTSNKYEKKGYTFTGWSTDVNGEVKYENNAIAPNSEEHTEITLYAQWKANTYEVKFEANGGSGDNMANQSFTYDDTKKALSANTYTRVGYEFVGWNTSADGTGIPYENKANVSNLTTENNGIIILYAQWEANTYTVKFNANGGEGTMDDIQLTYDQSQALTKNNFTKAGYIFIGWSKLQDGGVDYEDEEVVENLASEGEFTLYAVWRLDTSVGVGYHDLYIIESIGAELISRYDKDRTPDGGSFTLSLEKEEGYEDCEPTVYYKRGRFGEWKELKLDEVSGYYQIRSVYTDIYVKVSGDGIWPVSNETVEAQEVEVYTRNGAIVVSTPSLMEVQIVSMTGAQVAADKVAGQREFRNLAEGIYVVRVGEEIVKVRL